MIKQTKKNIPLVGGSILKTDCYHEGHHDKFRSSSSNGDSVHTAYLETRRKCGRSSGSTRVDN